MEKSIKSSAIPYGVYLGIVLVFITVFAYAIDLDIFTRWWFNIINFIAVLVIAVLAVTKTKQTKQDGFSFKEAFTSYFITVVIGTFISSIINLLLFNLIDPEAAGYIMEKTIEMTREMLEKFGTPREEIEKAVSELSGENQFSPANYARGYVFYLGFYALIGLIVALIFRDKNTNSD